MRLLESATILNLIILSAETLYKWGLKVIIAYCANWNHFAQAYVIVLIKPCPSIGQRCKRNQG